MKCNCEVSVKPRKSCDRPAPAPERVQPVGVDFLSNILGLPDPLSACRVSSSTSTSTSTTATSSGFSSRVPAVPDRGGGGGRDLKKTVPGLSGSHRAPSAVVKAVPPNPVRPCASGKSGSSAPPSAPRKNPPPKPGVKTPLPIPRPGAKSVPRNSVKPVQPVQPVKRVDGKSGRVQPRPLVSSLTVPAPPSDPGQERERESRERDEVEQELELENHWDRYKASVFPPVSAQRTPASTDEFFQSFPETNNNLNPPDQRNPPRPVRIWFTPLSNLLRPDVLSLTAQTSRMVSPAVSAMPPPVAHHNPSPTSVLREAQDVCQDETLHREVRGFLHHYLATNMQSEPQSSKVEVSRLYQDYQRFSKEQRQSSIYIFPSDK